MSPIASVGRAVHVHHKSFKSQPRPATISFVHPDGSVALNAHRSLGVDENPKGFQIAKIELQTSPPTQAQLEELFTQAGPDAYYANWPPYVGEQRPPNEQGQRTDLHRETVPTERDAVNRMVGLHDMQIKAIGLAVSMLLDERPDIRLKVDKLMGTSHDRNPSNPDPRQAPAEPRAGRIGPAGIEAKPLATEPLSLNVGYMAAQVHERWRTERARDYSPYNKPWEALSDQARRGISRQARQAVDCLAEQLTSRGIPFTIDDPYEAMESGSIPEIDGVPTKPFDMEKIREEVAGSEMMFERREIEVILNAVAKVHGLKLHVPASADAAAQAETTGG